MAAAELKSKLLTLGWTWSMSFQDCSQPDLTFLLYDRSHPV